MHISFLHTFVFLTSLVYGQGFNASEPSVSPSSGEFIPPILLLFTYLPTSPSHLLLSIDIFQQPKLTYKEQR